MQENKKVSEEAVVIIVNGMCRSCWRIIIRIKGSQIQVSEKSDTYLIDGEASHLSLFNHCPHCFKFATTTTTPFPLTLPKSMVTLKVTQQIPSAAAVVVPVRFMGPGMLGVDALVYEQSVKE